MRLFFALVMLLFSCRVTLITGYDQVLDQHITRMKKEFNLHFIKLNRTLKDDNPRNQDYANFQEYYDNLEADLITISSRAKRLDKNGLIVQQQIRNLDASFRTFMQWHGAGVKDNPADDRRDIRDAVNSSLDAISLLQESLKAKGKTE
jgi:hypothetical protein